jgi:hypothetical protein
MGVSIKIDINYLTSRGKRTTQKRHEKYECAKFFKCGLC